MNEFLKTSNKKQYKPELTNSVKRIGSTISVNHFAPFIPLPATILGTCTMIYFDVPTYIWLLNITFVCLGTFTSLFFLRNPILPKKSNPFIVFVILIILLLGTFYDNGIMNVHRWINFGSLQLNIGLLVSPLMLIQISRITNPKLAILFSAIATIIFFLQPDASLVSAFSVSIFVLLLRKFKAEVFTISYLLFTLFMVSYAWYNLDNLEPVSYVENIISLTKEISMALYLGSLISLLLLIIPFIYYSKKDDLSISLGIYFLVLLLATLFGHFPVMLMGYGISPIIGYFIGLIWQINTSKT
ncbi:MAG: hypothetical protein JWP69_1739 [Flaviaesturariibacter sp.]|nr:hypothetical protein [Flaviaesturariibacter sp.]